MPPPQSTSGCDYARQQRTRTGSVARLLGWRCGLQCSAVAVFGRRFLWFLAPCLAERDCLVGKGRRDRGADRRSVADRGRDRASGAGQRQRLLISGVNPIDQRPRDRAIAARSMTTIVTCCVDLDRTAVNTITNATETRRWVRERGLQVADRGDLELSHAARDGGIVASASRHLADRLSGGERPAEGGLGQWSDLAAPLQRICEVYGRGRTHAGAGNRPDVRLN